MKYILLFGILLCASSYARGQELLFTKVYDKNGTSEQFFCEKDKDGFYRLNVKKNGHIIFSDHVMDEVVKCDFFVLETINKHTYYVNFNFDVTRNLITVRDWQTKNIIGVLEINTRTRMFKKDIQKHVAKYKIIKKLTEAQNVGKQIRKTGYFKGVTLESEMNVSCQNQNCNIIQIRFPVYPYIKKQKIAYFIWDAIKKKVIKSEIVVDVFEGG